MSRVVPLVALLSHASISTAVFSAAILKAGALAVDVAHPMRTLTKGNLTWIIPSEGEGVWLDAARSLVGIDDDDGLTSWYSLAGKLVEVRDATDEQIEMAEQYATE